MQIEIIIPKFPEHRVIAKCIRPKYWKYSNQTKTFMSGKKKIGVRLKAQLKKGLLASQSNILVHASNGRPVLANPRTAGKPRYRYFNLNNIYSTGTPFERVHASLDIKSIKNHAFKYVKDIKPIDKKFYPLQITIEIHCTLKNNHDNKDVFGQIWDGDNKADLYKKPLVDLLCNNNTKNKYPYEGIIIDDDRFLVRSIAYIVPLPEERYEDRYIRIIISSLKDERFINNKLIKQYYKKFNNETNII
jgi:hypothetical protein